MVTLSKDKMYLITGGTGFLAATLLKRLKGFKLRVVARNEGLLVALKDKYPHIEILAGNINNPFTCEKACRGVDGIFHLAAFKHVGLAEENARECIESNVIGTLNLLEETRRVKPEFIIGISSDKAARVSGVYGATKLLQERLFQEYHNIVKEVKYRTVRYGNVLYSTGSVLCKWRDRIMNGLPITATDLDATRFFWTVDEAVDLIFDCLANSTDATPRIVKMKSIRLGDLLDAMIKKYADTTEQYPQVTQIGLQAGENLHEVIDDNGTDSFHAEHYTKEEIMGLI